MNSKKGSLKLLVDSGASISLIKSSSLIPKTKYFINEIITIRGIDNIKKEPIKTVGYTILELFHNKEPVSHKFHILASKSNITCDGILGNDFLEKFKVNLNYKDSILEIPNSNSIIKIPLLNNINDNNIILKPRSETLIKVNVLNPEIGEGIITNTVFQEGVFLSKAITKVDENSNAYATVINTLEKPVLILKAKIILEEIPKDTLIFQTNKDSKNIRKEKLLNNLRLDHLNDEERQSIQKICLEFNGIFHLEGDILTTTNAIKHEINTTTNSPIVTKTYRYPEVHKAEVNSQIQKMLKQNIIKPSKSPWSAPLWIVPKKLDASGKKK